MGELQESVRALDARISALIKSSQAREAILKTYVLNQYAMMALGCGFILSPRAVNELVVTFFDEIVTTHPKIAQKQIVELRRRLVAEYPFWVPNLFYLAQELKRLGKDFKAEARKAFFNAYSLIENLVIDSDHYAQLWIDARHDPLSKECHWPSTNQMPWFVVQNMLNAFRDEYSKDDVPQIIERLLLK